jgi:hypothetical protein
LAGASFEALAFMPYIRSASTRRRVGNANDQKQKGESMNTFTKILINVIIAVFAVVGMLTVAYLAIDYFDLTKTEFVVYSILGFLAILGVWKLVEVIIELIKNTGTWVKQVFTRKKRAVTHDDEE